jgi:Ala-tRNA(Pro) deacylase
MNVQERVMALLLRAGASVRTLDHPPGATALELAASRGTDPRDGGKSIVMKLEQQFAVVVIPGDGRLEGKRVRRALAVQRYRFATPEELHELTGLQAGEVPPFGRPIFELELVVDSAVAEREQIVFTAGRRDQSLVVPTRDWLRAAAPARVVSLAQGGAEGSDR